MPNLDPFTTCQVAIRAASHLHVRNREWIAAARGVEPFVLAYMDDPDRPHLVEPDPEPELVITMPAVPIPHPGDVKRTEIAFMRYVLVALALAVACALAGCGGGPGSSPLPKTHEVGLSNPYGPQPVPTAVPTMPNGGIIIPTSAPTPHP